jgi:hypothetical protein
MSILVSRPRNRSKYIRFQLFYHYSQIGLSNTTTSIVIANVRLASIVVAKVGSAVGDPDSKIEGLYTKK